MKMSSYMHMYMYVYIRNTDAYPVRNFVGTVLAGTTFNFSWRPPSIAAHLTTGYNLTCVPLLTGIPVPETLELLPTATAAEVTGLFRGVTYSCSIITIGSGGASEPQTLTLTTAESCKCFHKLCNYQQVYNSVLPTILISTFASSVSCS